MTFNQGECVPAYNSAFESIGSDFVKYYYSKFDVGDPAVQAEGLSPLYCDEHSFLTFEGNTAKGRQAILEKFSVIIAIFES